MHSLWFDKHQHDNRVRSKLFIACQRWGFHWRFWFIPSVPGYLREEEEHKPDPWRNPIERNHMGLHLQNEVAVVKTPTVISNNHLLRHWHVVHRQGIFPRPGFLVFNYYYFFPFTESPIKFNFFSFIDKNLYAFLFFSNHIIRSALSSAWPCVTYSLYYNVSPSPDHRTLLDGLDLIATVGIKERPQDNKFTWRVISLLQNSRTSVGQSWSGTERL